MKDNMLSDSDKSWINKWSAILKRVVNERYENVRIPTMQKKAQVAGFSELSKPTQMYLCGLLSDHQFETLSFAEEDYMDKKGEELSQNESDPQRVDELMWQVPYPTYNQLVAGLEEPEWHSPVMLSYAGIANRMGWIAQILNKNELMICSPDTQSDMYVNFMDGLHDYQIAAPDKPPYIQKLDAVDFLTQVKNSCVLSNPELDIGLITLTQRFRDDTLTLLRSMPEIPFTKGTAKRAALAASFWKTQMGEGGFRSDLSTEALLCGCITLCRDLLATQISYDSEWQNYCLKWYDNATLEFVNQLKTDNQQSVTPDHSDISLDPQKLGHQSNSMPQQDNPNTHS